MFGNSSPAASEQFQRFAKKTNIRINLLLDGGVQYSISVVQVAWARISDGEFYNQLKFWR